MIVVRMVFHARLGRGAKVVAAMKEMAGEIQKTAAGAHHIRILTDLSGRFDTVVQELEYDSVDSFLRDLAAMSGASDSQQPDGGQWFELMEGGYKEYYTVEFEQ